MQEKSENSFLYLMKFIACCMVIVMHTRFPEPFGAYADSFCKVAVPFFFALSGRFLLQDKENSEKYAVLRETEEIRERMKKRLKKAAFITLRVYLLYLAFSLLYHLYNKDTFATWFTTKFNFEEAKIFLLFNSGKFIYDGSYIYDHLWYMFALIYVYLLIFIFAPVLRKWYRGLIVLLFLGLFAANLLQNYYPIRPFGISIKTWYVVRNWLFIGLPYVLLGVLFGDFVCEKRDKYGDDFRLFINRFKIPAVIILAAGIISGLLEVYRFGEKQSYFGSLLITVSILFLSETGITAKGLLPEIGKKYSGSIYYYHILAMAILDNLAYRGYLPYASGYLRAPVMVVIMVAIFGIIPICKERVYEKRRVS